MAEPQDIKYYILDKEIPLDLLNLMLNYVSEFREKGIAKTSYQPFLRDLLTTLNKTPTEDKRKLIRSECKAFLERHNK